MRHRPSTSLKAVSLSNRDIRPTMNVYTHLQLIDTAGAVELLPSVGAVRREPAPQLATGTDGR